MSFENRYPNTTGTYDTDDNRYPAIRDKLKALILEKSKTLDVINILVPGAGSGRIICGLINDLNEDSSGYKKINIYIVEPIKGNINKLENKVSSLNNKINIILNNITIERFLLNCKEQPILFDLILCFQFFHYVNYGWVSILKELLYRLKEGGCFVIDRLIGADKEDQSKIELIDCHIDKLFNFEGSDKNEWRDYYLNKLGEGQIWASNIKATDIDLALESIRPFFERIEEYESENLNITLANKHMPWWWASSENRENGQLPEDKTINIKFKAYFSINKKSFNNSEHHWKNITNLCIAKSVESYGSILNILREDEYFDFVSFKKYVQEKLPSIIMQIISSSGIIDFKHKINSIFIAAGEFDPLLNIPKLNNIFVLINNNDGKGDEKLKSWICNYIIFSKIIRHPLSEDFIRERKKTALVREGIPELIRNNLEYQYGFNVLKDVQNISDNIKDIGKLGVEIRIKGIKRRRLIWWDLLEIDKDYQPNNDLIDNINNKICSEINKKIQDGDNRIKYLSFLVAKNGDILFYPIPSYIISSSKGFNVKSMLGLGVNVELTNQNINDLIKNIEDILRLFRNLLMKYIDNYIALRWIDYSRDTALRAAVAAIFTRNMSHNIGSHILTRVNINEYYEKINKALDCQEKK